MWPLQLRRVDPVVLALNAGAPRPSSRDDPAAEGLRRLAQPGVERSAQTVASGPRGFHVPAGPHDPGGHRQQDSPAPAGDRYPGQTDQRPAEPSTPTRRRGAAYRPWVRLSTRQGQHADSCSLAASPPAGQTPNEFAAMLSGDGFGLTLALRDECRRRQSPAESACRRALDGGVIEVGKRVANAQARGPGAVRGKSGCHRAIPFVK